jgi:hypothetical protein
VTRKELITKIEDLCKCRLICYVTGDRKGQEAQISEDALPLLYEHLAAIGKVDRLAFFTYSRGGQTLPGFALANSFREFAKEVDILIPFRAQSCATLISLSGNRIVMGPFGQLSPIDPSITTPHGPSIQHEGQVQFIPVSVEDVANYFSLARSEAKVSEEKMNEVFSRLSERVNPLALGAVYRAREQIGMLANKLLKRHLSDDKRIEKIVNSLTRDLLSHDYVIGRTEAKELGLPIEQPSEEVAGLMWNLYLDFAEEMRLSHPWVPETELGTQQSVKKMNVRAVVESKDKKHGYCSSYEMKRTSINKDGVKYDAAQTKLVDDSWRPL